MLNYLNHPIPLLLLSLPIVQALAYFIYFFMAVAVLFEEEGDLEISLLPIHTDVATIELHSIEPIAIFGKVIQIEIDASSLGLSQPGVLVQFDEYVSY